MTQSNRNSPAVAPGFLEYLSDGVIVLDKQQQIVSVNRAAAHLLGWESSELIGRPWIELLREQPSIVHPSGDEATHFNRVGWFPFNSDSSSSTKQASDDTVLVYHSELTINCKNGNRREVSASFSPLYLPDLSTEIAVSVKMATQEQAGYSLVILRDVTEQKRLERIKTQFVVTAAHQLRTPLASIKNSVGLLLENVPSSLAQPLWRLLYNIQSSSLKMERLVNDLVELASLQSGLVQLSEGLVEVSSIMEQVTTANQEKLQQKRQSLELVLPASLLFVKGDRARLAQVLGHLLSNASKFSSAGSPIKLRATVVTAQSGSSGVVFSVTDKGRGINLEEQSLIFEKFYQSEISENADGSGVGLGLPLAKALVELHGGRLWFESTLGLGSTFYFELPLVYPDPAYLHYQAKAAGSSSHENFDN